MRLTRIVIADDHPLMLDGTRGALDRSDDFEIVGEAHSGSEVLPVVGRTDPDVVLLDIRMPGMDGLACLERIRQRHPQVKVVMLSAFNEPEQITAALKRGASGYIVKSVNPLDLPAALRQILDGTVYHALGLTDDDEPARGTGLTDRELGILKAVARGLSNQAIGKELWVTEQTVKFHLTNIYRKIGVTNRTEAARHAYQHSLVESPALELAEPHA
jgi:DNA-binding NarL/FixJ family response regulator